MLSLLHKKFLPISVIFIGGMMLTFGSSDTLLANTQANYDPVDRPTPQRTQGGGSRFHLITNIYLS